MGKKGSGPVERFWIGTVTALSTKTVLVKAKSRKEAEEKLRQIPTHEDVEGLDVNYEERARRILREDHG